MKLSPLTIIIIGIMICIPIVCFGFFDYWIPKNKEAEMNDTVDQQLKDEAGKQGKATTRKKLATTKVIQTATEWSAFIKEKMPPSSLPTGIDLSVKPYQLTVDTPKFRDSIQRAVNNQLHAGGVKILSGPYVPGPDPNASANSLLASFYNYPAIPFPVVIFDLGTVTVQGTYKQIFDNMRAWSRMPHYLAVADSLRLDGTSPVLTGTYNLTIVGFINGAVIAPPVPEAAMASNTSPFGGGGGNPFGPGGPPGMPPGVGGPGGRFGGPPGGAGGRSMGAPMGAPTGAGAPTGDRPGK